jgi:hypothetical protein
MNAATLTQEESRVGIVGPDAKSELNEGIACPGDQQALRNEAGAYGNTQRPECTGAVDETGLIESVTCAADRGEREALNEIEWFDEAALTIRT